jgi:hypothetical protein
MLFWGPRGLAKEAHTDELEAALKGTMRIGANQRDVDLLGQFLCENVLPSDVKVDIHKDPEELGRLREENVLIKWAEGYVDNHPLSEVRSVSEPVRRAIWKASGVRCDDFSMLHIGKSVRVFNPTNLTLVSGGYPMYLAGVRSGTFIDGRGKVIIFGPIDMGAGVKIFTHVHNMDNPGLPHYHQGRTLVPSVVYPDCFIGEDTHIMGILNIKSVVADFTVTTPKQFLPPYSVIGGIGSDCRVLRYLGLPKQFPPEHLRKVYESARRSFPPVGRLLGEYYMAVEELIEATDITDRAQYWSKFRERIDAAQERCLGDL